MIANTIIASVLRKLLVVAGGREPSVSQYADGLEALNDLVRIWSADASLIYQDTLESITIPADTQSFTMGSTGDFTSGKPVKLLNASIKTSSYEYVLRMADKNIYENFRDKTYKGVPSWIYFRNTNPDSSFYFNVTTDTSYELILTTYKSLSEFPDGTTDVPLPAYYETALKFNLLLFLAAEFGYENRLTSNSYRLADDSKSAVIGRAVKINTSKTGLTYINGYLNNGNHFNNDRSS